MSSVVVTGAAGFLGSAVVRALVAAGVSDVVAVARPGRTFERLEELPPESWSHAEIDLAAPDADQRLRQLEPRAVLHVALDREAYRTVDDAYSERPLRALLSALEGRPNARFVHTSSAWVLRAGDRLAEAAPLQPISPYAVNKARADELTPSIAAEHGVDWMILRPFNLFGRYEPLTRLIPHLVTQLSAGLPAELSHGRQLRDFNDVDVVAQAYVAALRAPETACGAVYHLGSGRGTTTRELALLVAAELGRPDLLRFGASKTADDDVPALVADPTRARETLGWSARQPLEEWVRRAVAWWRARPGADARPGRTHGSLRDEVLA